jgi:hypothetical protein
MTKGVKTFKEVFIIPEDRNDLETLKELCYFVNILGLQNKQIIRINIKTECFSTRIEKFIFECKRRKV